MSKTIKGFISVLTTVFIICLSISNIYGGSASDRTNNTNRWLPDYYSLGGTIAFQSLEDIHTRSTSNLVGVILPEVKSFDADDTNIGLNLALGKRFRTSSNNLIVRPELQFLLLFADLDEKVSPAFTSGVTAINSVKIDIRTSAIFFNMFLEKDISDYLPYKTNLYAGAGVGPNFQKVDSEIFRAPDKFTKSTTRMQGAWQLILGTYINMFGNTNLNISYSYVDYGKVHMGRLNTTSSLAPSTVILSKFRSDNLVSHNINIGLLFDAF